MNMKNIAIIGAVVVAAAAIVLLKQGKKAEPVGAAGCAWGAGGCSDEGGAAPSIAQAPRAPTLSRSAQTRPARRPASPRSRGYIAFMGGC